MPHECVSCGEVFEDGADEVFDGCPDCGATRFFYVKEVTEEPDEAPSADDPERRSDEDVGVDVDPSSEPTTARSPESPIPDAEKETQPDSSRSPSGEDSSSVPTQTPPDSDDDIVEAESEYKDSFGGRIDSETEAESDSEDTITADEPEPSSVTTDDSGRKFRRARPDEARRRLLDQFETIRIVEPGSYELNLMNLYEEEEKIIALQEDGKYQVSLPSTIGDD